MKSGYGLLEGLVGWKAELEEGGGWKGSFLGIGISGVRDAGGRGKY